MYIGKFSYEYDSLLFLQGSHSESNFMNF